MNGGTARGCPRGSPAKRSSLAPASSCSPTRPRSTIARKGRPRPTPCCSGARQVGSTPRSSRHSSARADRVFAELDAGSVWDTVLAEEPWPAVIISEQRVDDLAEALADAVDLKSPYFLGHSPGVARLAEQAAVQLGLGDDESAAIRRAGLFHDLGRVGVSNLVWDKPGSLSAAEWEQVRLHAYHTERILARSPMLAPLCGDRRHAPRAQ